MLLSQLVAYLVLNQSYNVVETTREDFLVNFAKPLLRKLQFLSRVTVNAKQRYFTLHSTRKQRDERFF